MRVHLKISLTQQGSQYDHTVSKGEIAWWSQRRQRHW